MSDYTFLILQSKVASKKLIYELKTKIFSIAFYQITDSVWRHIQFETKMKVTNHNAINELRMR